MQDIIKTLIPPEANDKQRALLETAFELFRKHGMRRVSIEEICSTARVSKVTFYKHFSGKTELILFIVRRLIDSLQERISRTMQSGMPIKEIFDRVSITKQDFVASIGEEMMRGIMSLPEAKSYLDELSQASLIEFRAFLIAQQNAGNINPKLDVDTILALLMAINQIYTSGKLEGQFSSTEELIRQMNELLVYGMLVR